MKKWKVGYFACLGFHKNDPTHFSSLFSGWFLIFDLHILRIRHDFPASEGITHLSSYPSQNALKSFSYIFNPFWLLNWKDQQPQTLFLHNELFLLYTNSTFCDSKIFRGWDFQDVFPRMSKIDYNKTITKMSK